MLLTIKGCNNNYLTVCVARHLKYNESSKSSCSVEYILCSLQIKGCNNNYLTVCVARHLKYNESSKSSCSMEYILCILQIKGVTTIT